MLLNIVRSRYQDMPVFLAVSSVVTQYAYDRSASLFAQRENIDQGLPTTDTFGADVNVGYSELPTITYAPVLGERFASHLYSVIASNSLFAAAQSGWAIDLLMRIGVQRLGAAENMSFSEVRVKKDLNYRIEKLERFVRAIELLFILSEASVLEFHQNQGDPEKGLPDEQLLVLNKEVPDDLRPLLAEFRELVGLDDSNRFLITDRIVGLEEDEMSVQTRSVMAMIKFMGRGVEIPAQHIEEGRVIDYELQGGDAREAMARLFPFRIHSSKDRPRNAFSAVRYEDHWYYVAQDDVESKRALEHVMILFQLKAPTQQNTAPLLTLPTR